MLNIVVVQGEGAINNIRQRTARQTIVRVEDENHKPVGGAVVVFLLPSQGASGTFAGGVQMLTVTTNRAGLAVARGFRPNQISGQYQMNVNASFGGQMASTAISQTNALPGAVGTTTATGISPKVIAIVAVIGGAAAVGIALAATGSGGGSSTPAPSSTVNISPTSGTVGAPR